MVQPLAGRIQVVVHDRSRMPVEKASVEAIQFAGIPIPPVETDDHGIAVLDIPAGVEISHILALKNGAGFDYFEKPSSGSSDRQTTLPPIVHLSLGGAMEVQVRAIDAAGRPVSNVLLTPWMIKCRGKRDRLNCSAGQVTLASTDEAGIARFSWIPAELDALTQFLVRDKAYYCPRTAWIDLAAPWRPLTVCLLRAVPVSGRVLFPDSSPCSGITVRAEGRGWSNWYCRRSTVSTPDGRYEFLLWPEQSYLLSVDDEAWAARSLQGVVVREGQPRVGLDLYLTRGTRLQGRISLGLDRAPACGQTVTLVECGGSLGTGLSGHFQQEELVRRTKTDEDGRYQFRVGPGRYRLQGPSPSSPEQLTLNFEEEVARDFSLSRPAHGLLTGEVRRLGGESVRHAAIFCYSIVQEHAWLQMAADSEGRFAGERWRDRMLLYARDTDGTEAGCTEITEQDDQATITISPAATVRGRVVDGVGAPCPKQEVLCRMRTALGDGTVVSIQLETWTDEFGQFLIPGLLLGTSCDITVLKGDQAISPQHAFDVERVSMLDLPDIVIQ